METKTITVSEEADDRLRARRREGESFSDAIIRLTGGERDVMRGFGAMSDAEGLREAVESAREDFDGRRD